jgi:hypothetical protein
VANVMRPYLESIGLLFKLWYDTPHRATRDADLLGFGASDLTSVTETFRDNAAAAAQYQFSGSYLS